MYPEGHALESEALKQRGRPNEIVVADDRLK